MNLQEEIWREIDSTIKIPEEIKKNLHMRIMKAIETSRLPAGQKLGVTIMTQEASLAADRVVHNRNAKPSPGDTKPKSI